jgi:hypothetical protein
MNHAFLMTSLRLDVETGNLEEPTGHVAQIPHELSTQPRRFVASLVMGSPRAGNGQADL